MSWLEDTDNSADTKVAEDNWLKIPSPTTVGKTTEVRVRVLDQEPIGTWRHWFESHPYNCPGFDTCPVCKVRQQASKDDPENYKDKYRLDYRYFFNVLSEHEVKVWSFTSTVGRKLKVFEQKYGDLGNYDISITKRKTGPLEKNVEYDVIYEKEYALSDEDTATSEAKFNREPFVKPADLETLRQVAQGQKPVYAGESDGEPKDEGKPKSNKPTKADMITLKALVEAKGFDLADFGIVETTPPPKDVILKLIDGLKQEKS